MHVKKIKNKIYCPICSTEENQHILYVDSNPSSVLLDDIELIDEIKCYMCRKCNILYNNKFLDDSGLKNLYAKIGGSKTYYFENSNVALHRSKQNFNVIKNNYDISMINEILDYGGGVGQASLEFALQGYKVYVSDFEYVKPIHPEVEYLNRDIIFSQSYKFQLIILSHILEHLWDPVLLLDHFKKCMDPNGCIYAEVPYEIPNQLIGRHLGDPCHVIYFSPESFVKVAKILNMRIQFIDASISKYDDRIIPVIRIIFTNKKFQKIKVNFLKLKLFLYYLLALFYNKTIRNFNK